MYRLKFRTIQAPAQVLAEAQGLIYAYHSSDACYVYFLRWFILYVLGKTRLPSGEVKGACSF